jgi:hypothetical protein
MNKELNRAAENYSSAHYKSPVGSRLYIYKTEAFKAGAEWQKEQDKQLLNKAYQLIEAFEVRYPNTNQLLLGHTNAAILEELYCRLYPEQPQD